MELRNSMANVYIQIQKKGTKNQKSRERIGSQPWSVQSSSVPMRGHLTSLNFTSLFCCKQRNKPNSTNDSITLLISEGRKIKEEDKRKACHRGSNYTSNIHFFPSAAQNMCPLCSFLNPTSPSPTRFFYSNRRRGSQAHKPRITTHLISTWHRGQN